MTLRGLHRAGLVVSVVLAGIAHRTSGQGLSPAELYPLPPLPVPTQNPITEPKRLLGKVLFWDEQLSSDNTVACGTCHIMSSAGADPRFARHPGHDATYHTDDDVFGSAGVRRADGSGAYHSDPLFGAAPQVTNRSAPILTGIQWHTLLFWDGRATGRFVDPETGAVVMASGGALESQAVAPILSDVEMGHEGRDWNDVRAKLAAARPLAFAADLPPDVAAALAGGASYPQLFAAAFGDGAISARRIAFAIATYERTLVPNETPWDRSQRGDADAMTPSERTGFGFFRASECNICHVPPTFSDNTFRNIGLRPVVEDQGRRNVTGALSDRGKFKVPTLRNTGLKRSFMHTGHLTTLDEVVDFYDHVNGQEHFLDNQDFHVRNINIPSNMRQGLIDFLTTGLTDPRVANEEFPFDRPRLHSEIAADMAALAECMAGPELSPAPGEPMTAAECLARFDDDADGDVDLADAARFARVYSSP